MQRVLKNPYVIVVDGNSVDRTIEIAKTWVQIFYFRKIRVKETQCSRESNR